MTRVLIDTNVILDVLLEGEPHLKSSQTLWAAIEKGLAEGLLSAHALTTIHYLIGRGQNSGTAKRAVASLLRVFQVAAVDHVVMREALEMPSADFEDAVTAAAARAAGCDFIVTRDPKGFRGSRVRVLSPEAAAPLLTRSVV